jgi:hypothetical protein
MHNPLAGAGARIKSEDTPLTLHTINPAFVGTATIAQGTLTALHIATLGTAPITVAAGATFEQRNTAGPLQNPLAGEGTHLITNNSTVSITPAAAYTIQNTTLDPTRALHLAAPGIRLGTLALNTGTLVFPAAPATLTTTATIATLATAGAIVMNADFALATTGINPAGKAANHLTIATNAAGQSAIYINAINAPALPNVSIELITLNTARDTDFILANPGRILEYGFTAFELVRGDSSPYTPDHNKWYLSDRAYSHTADAIINTVASFPLEWSYSLDALHLRMGEVRTETLRSDVARSDVARASSPWSSSSTGFQPVNPSAPSAQSNPSAPPPTATSGSAPAPTA